MALLSIRSPKPPPDGVEASWNTCCAPTSFWAGQTGRSRAVAVPGRLARRRVGLLSCGRAVFALDGWRNRSRPTGEENMSAIYGEKHRALQEMFDTTRLADRIEGAIVRPDIPRDYQAFIESRDMFFLASVDHRGFPTCSYKGGAPGFVRVVDPRTIA